MEMLEEVKSLVTRCLDGDPDHRPSFSDISRDLERTEFSILPNMDSLGVKRFVSEAAASRTISELYSERSQVPRVNTGARKLR
jgi:serine/threonine protein kinase